MAPLLPNGPLMRLPHPSLMSLRAAYASHVDARLMAHRTSPLRATGRLNGWRPRFGDAHVGGEDALATLVEDPVSQVSAALYDIAPMDEELLDRWEGAGTPDIHRRTRVRVHTLDGEESAWAHVLNGYEGGLPSARHLGGIADAAESAGTPTAV